MEKLCKDLTSTYDTNILDNEDKTVQDEFLNVSRKNRKNKIGKKVLMKLICNHYDENVQKQKPNAEFIGGPKSLSIHWHPGFKKLIYIFGESHVNRVDCDKIEKDANTTLIEDYLYDLMIKTDVFLDIYFEFLSYKDGEYDFLFSYDPSRFSELFKKFRKCLQYNTRSDISCQLARVHYFDIRSNDYNEMNLEENKINILWFTGKLSYIILNKEGIEDAVFQLKLLLKQYPKIITLLKELLNDDIKKVCEFMKKQLEENPYIKKELSKISNPQLKTFILNFFGKLLCEEMTKTIPRIKNAILNILNNEKELEDYIIFNSMESLNTFFVGPMVYFADVYLLGRVFKNFDMEKKKDKTYFDQPNRAHNIIIYCGNEHANNYRDFLSSMLFHDIEHTGALKGIPETAWNCIDMRNIKQPFFSYSDLPTTPKTPPKTPPPKILSKKDQTGRTVEEIRAYIIDMWDDIELVGNIPDIIAKSKDSSYRNVDIEVEKRQNEIRKRIGRTAEEIRAYMIEVQEWDVKYIGDIPEMIAKSKDSSYFHAEMEAARRYHKIQREENKDIIYT
jgi:hypothetical protein